MLLASDGPMVRDPADSSPLVTGAVVVVASGVAVVVRPAHADVDTGWCC